MLLRRMNSIFWYGFLPCLLYQYFSEKWGHVIGQHGSSFSSKLCSCQTDERPSLPNSLAAFKRILFEASSRKNKVWVNHWGKIGCAWTWFRTLLLFFLLSLREAEKGGWHFLIQFPVKEHIQLPVLTRRQYGWTLTLYTWRHKRVLRNGLSFLCTIWETCELTTPKSF